MCPKQVVSLHKRDSTRSVLEYFSLLLNLSINAKLVVVSIGLILILIILVKVGVDICRVCI